MPPANSPTLDATATVTSVDNAALPVPVPLPRPARTPSPSTFLQRNAPTLSSPVLDLASTLTVQAEDDMDEDNVDFLRRPGVDEDVPAAAAAVSQQVRSERRRTDRQQTDQRDTSWSQLLHGARTERAMADLRNLSESEARERRLHQRRMAELRSAMDRRWNQDAARYGNPAPPYTSSDNSANALYDWAPAHGERDERDERDNPSETDAARVDSILADLRQQQPNTHPDVLITLARAQAEADRNYRRRNRQTSATQTHEQSLRSAAILQSVRRHRISAATRPDAVSRQHELIQRYNAARSELVRQYNADAQDGVLPESATANPEPGRLARAEDSLSLLDAMRLDVQGESSRSARLSDSGTSSLLRSLRLQSEARVGLDNVVISPSRTATPPAQRTLGDRSWHMSNRSTRVHPHETKTANVEFKHAMEVSRRLHDPDCEDVEALFRGYSFGLLWRKMPREWLLELQSRQPVPVNSHLRAGAQFVGSQSQQGDGVPPSDRDLSVSSLHDPDRPIRASYIPNFTAQEPSTAASGVITASSSSTTAAAAATTLPVSTNPLARMLHEANVLNGIVGDSTVRGPDRWTVRVSIHSVDYDRLTLQGTMEAFDVPSQPELSLARSSLRTDPLALINPSNNHDPASTSSQPPTFSDKTTFSTFVDGEIIDLARHPLLTSSSTFAPSDNPAQSVQLEEFDALYWRKLEPFASLADNQLAHALLDPRWIREQLLEKYILMRWKERCFVAPSNSSPPTGAAAAAATESPTTIAYTPQTPGASGGNAASGLPILSISGFYYVSMRRSDGHCQGLYYDPHNSPYQCLDLTPTMGVRKRRVGPDAVGAATDSKTGNGSSSSSSGGDLVSPSPSSSALGCSSEMAAGGSSTAGGICVGGALWAGGSWDFR